jgi:FAD/FMN-containing dehydrogenase
MASEAAVKALSEDLRGRLIQPDDSEYDEARTLYNAMIDKRPQFIARCADVADVIASIRFGQENELDTAIRGGGHSGPGLASVDDGLVIDLSEMKGTRVDPEKDTVRVGPGNTWGDVDHATHAFGRATVSGIISSTGVGGLTLGGGHGYLTRKYGLTIDNLLAADVVLADGSLVHASEDENPDLFWALRGGGGNFGVVTSFLFRTHPVHTVYGGPILWPIEEADGLLRWYRRFMREAPNDLYGWFGFHRVLTGSPFPEALHGRHVCAMTWCWTGPLDEAEEVFRPIRAMGSPVLDMAGPTAYPELQGMFDRIFYPPGLQWYWKADFVEDITDEAIERHKTFGASLPTERSTMHLYPINGAAGNVDSAETAFHFRDATWSRVIVGVDEDPASAGRIRRWATEYWDALHPYSAGGGYVNFMMEEGSDRVQAAYGDNYARLRRIKARYDPENFFHVNQNIEPADPREDGEPSS